MLVKLTYLLTLFCSLPILSMCAVFVCNTLLYLYNWGCCSIFRFHFYYKKSLLLFSCVWLSDTPWTAARQDSVLHHLPEIAQIHVLWVKDAIKASHLLNQTSPTALNFSPNQGLFKWVGSSYQVAKVLELQIQHQYFHWIATVDFL